MALVATACLIAPGDPGPADVVLSINTAKGVAAIDDAIYGSNTASRLGPDSLGAVRLGGNRWTAYNWENNASNAGTDWCSQNDGFLSGSSTPGAAVLPTVTAARDAGATAIVTVPIVDVVAADKNGGSGPPACSGDVRNSGANYLTTRFRQNVAATVGALPGAPNAGDATVTQDQFAAWLATAAPGTDTVFSLDNEPDLWSSTHPAIHPAAVTYAELLERTLRFSTALKHVRPDAEVAGPVSYGFNGFETLQGAPDRAGKGNFVEWYLAQLAAADATAGFRHVDYLDLHWYPEARGAGTRITGTETSPAVVAARVQAPRSLWDPTYLEDSWITTDYGYGPIRLLPRMQEKIAAHNPGTKLAVTEWNYGGGGHISGAVATADVLGTFGVQGVGLATYWELHGDESYARAAFRAYRNYDGAGAAFGDRSAEATSSNVAATSVYASTRTGDPTKVIVVAVNRSTTPKQAAIAVTHGKKLTTGRAFRIAAGSAQVVPAGTVTPVAQNAFNETLPAMSVTVFELSAA